MADELRMDYINSLPQPFLAKFGDDWQWEVESIGVDIPWIRINVCGLLEVKEFCEVSEIEDANGVVHDPETFWADWEPDDKPPSTTENENV